MNEKNVPKIRFQGFNEPWKQCKLGDVIDYIVDNRGKNPKYYCKSGIPVIDNYMIKNTLYPNLTDANRFIDDYLFNNFIRKYNEADDILITLVGNGIGNISLFPREKAVIIQNTLGLRTSENKIFLFFLLMKKNKDIVALDRGMAQPSIRQDELLDIDISIPTYKEQEQIGNFFKKLDNLISLHQQKLEHLKKKKKGLLQKMFPKAGAKVPEIRFPEFTGDWEQRKLGDVVDVRSGRDYKHLSEGSIPVYGTGGYMLSVNEALSYDEDAIGIGRKGTIDNPYILKAPFWTVDTLFYAIPKGNFDLDFVFDIFQNIDWKKKDESTGVPSLSKTAINEIDILIPKYDEQKKIGKYFKQLDNLISLHQRKLEHLQKQKKALLQQMFI